MFHVAGVVVKFTFVWGGGARGYNICVGREWEIVVLLLFVRTYSTLNNCMYIIIKYIIILVFSNGMLWCLDVDVDVDCSCRIFTAASPHSSLVSNPICHSACRPAIPVRWTCELSILSDMINNMDS